MGRPALNEKILSDHRVSKHVVIGYKQLDNVIDYQATFTVPEGEQHRFAQFEALTGYMPAEFRNFWKFIPATGKLEEIHGPASEQEFPLVFSTNGGTHAMGIFSPYQPSRGFERSDMGSSVFRWKKSSNGTACFGFEPATTTAKSPREITAFKCSSWSARWKM